MTGEVVLVRYGEIFLKGGKRGYFERRLLDRVRLAASAVGGRVDKTHGRLLAWPGEGGADRLVRALERVFGVSSLSPAQIVPRDLDAISRTAVELTRRERERLGGRITFKVESRRADKRFQPASPEISRLVGAAIVAALELPVDVHQPQLTVGVEIGFESAFVFAQTVPGPGGLPVGVTGKVELLLSGGIDSPVAGWMMLKRGCELGATYFHSFPYTGDKTKEKVIALARKLAAWQLGDVRLAVVPFTDAQKELRATGDGRLAIVLYRRMMLRVAERIARAAGAQALVTGEALAQVASQTLENLTVIGAAAELPILRPCLGHDKLDTIRLAERIGTFQTSILPYDDCCSLFLPEYPETRAKLADVLSHESKVDVNAIADRCAQATEKVICRPY